MNRSFATFLIFYDLVAVESEEKGALCSILVDLIGRQTVFYKRTQFLFKNKKPFQVNSYHSELIIDRLFRVTICHL